MLDNQWVQKLQKHAYSIINIPFELYRFRVDTHSIGIDKQQH